MERKCPTCGQGGKCYTQIIPGAAADSSMDITRFFFFGAVCQHAHQYDARGDWDHRCDFCGGFANEHGSLPEELKEKIFIEFFVVHVMFSQ